MNISARTFLVIWFVLAACLGGQFAYDFWLSSELPSGLLQVSGRMGGDAIPLPAGLPGKIISLDVKAGDFVAQGQVVGVLDGSSIQAQLDSVLREHDKLLIRRDLLLSEREIMKQDVPISIQIAKTALLKAEAKLEQARAEEEQRKNEQDRIKSRRKAAQDPEAMERAHLALVRARTHRQTDEAESARQAENVKLAELGFQKIDAANEELFVLQNQLDELERSAAAIRQSMGDPSIKAPIEGVVTKRLLGVGDLAAKDQAVAEMADPDRLFLRVLVPGSQVAHLAVGMSARVWLELHPETMFTAKIGFISEDPDLASEFAAVLLAGGAGNDTAPGPGKRANATGAGNASKTSGAPESLYGVRLYLDDNSGNVAMPGQTGVAVIRYNDEVSWRKPRKPFKK